MKFQNYKPSDSVGVVNLLNICFSGKTINNHSFEWKHYDRFFNNKTISMIATDKDLISAYVCFTPISIHYPDGSVHQYYSCAVQATHPDFRRRGLITHITKEIENQIGPNGKYVGFSNSSGVKIDQFSQKINYQIIGQWQTKIIPSWPRNSIFQLSETSTLPKLKYSSSLIGVEKEEDYLNWRYERYPKSKYSFFQIKSTQGIDGYVVARLKKLSLNIVEINLLNVDPEKFKEAVKACSDWAFCHGKLWLKLTFLPNKFWRQALPWGVTKPTEIYLTLKTPDQSILDPDLWFLQEGDVQ